MTRDSATPRTTRPFMSVLFRYPGRGGWTFAKVPRRHAPPVTHGWGRTPVIASVDGLSWPTSVWRGADGETLLPVPRHIRGRKGNGDTVRIQLRFEGDAAGANPRSRNAGSSPQARS